MMMMYAPRSSSIRSAHSSRFCAFSLAEPALDRALADEVADPERDVVAEDRAGRAGEDHERQAEVAGAREVPADDDERLARDEREERVDDRDAKMTG